LVSVRDRRVFVVQTLAASAGMPIAQRFVRLLFLLFGLRDAGAAQMVAIVPYLAYARKDRRTQPRDPVTSRYAAELFEATKLDRLIALDVHNPAALDNAFRIPVDHLSALPMFADHFARLLGGKDVAVASPDVGGVKRAQLFRELLAAKLQRDVGLLFIEKRRAEGKVSGGTIVGPVDGREVIVIDDLCASGGTLIRAAEVLRAAGAAAVHAAFAHAPLRKGLAALDAEANIGSIVTTDSVGLALPEADVPAQAKLTILPVAPLFGAAIDRIVSGRAVAPLLQAWPPPAD
jgi:ribose-phosphate pyrophosphokinase